MNKTTNLGLTLYEKADTFAITANEDSLNHNMELIDEAIVSKPGIKTNGGEVFNDYKNNISISEYSHSEGYNTVTGIKGYNIIAIASVTEGDNKYYDLTVNDVELEDKISTSYEAAIGQIVCLDTSNHLYDKFKLISVSNSTVRVQAIDNATTLSLSSTQSDNWIYIVGYSYGEVVPETLYAHAEGKGTKAIGLAAHAEGRDTNAIGNMSHAEGRETTAHYAAHAEGRKSVASGEMSHAEGYGTKASGDRAHSEGSSTTASGKNAHAEGESSKALGYASHA
jgi:hypothetical protein